MSKNPQYSDSWRDSGSGGDHSSNWSPYYKNRRKKSYYRNRNKSGEEGSTNRKEKKEFKRPYPEKRVRKILGKCFLCGANVSDDIYGMKFEDHYIHFECMVKHVRKKMREEMLRKKGFKVYYIGSGTFAAVMENNYKGNLKWDILLKVHLKELQKTEHDPIN